MREDTVPVVQQGISTSLQMLASLLLLIGSACLVPTAGAQTYTIIHNFTNGGDGATPQAGLTMDAGGNFYGTFIGHFRHLPNTTALFVRRMRA